MSKNQGVYLLALSSAFIAMSAFANPVVSQNELLQQQGLQVRGSVPVKIILSNQQPKYIQFMNIVLSKKVALQLSHNLSEILSHPAQNNLQDDNLPASHYVGMNGEPVLDQGQWGTCATFASTGAINALYPLLNEASVSQLCNLQLGRTLENPDPDGGWNGSLGYLVLGQIAQYGYINMQYQTQSGCGGLTQYPLDGGDNGQPMSIADFSAHSNHDFSSNDYSALWQYDGSFMPITPDQATTLLTAVKTALNAGDRVVFGSIIDVNVDEMDAGALGTYDGVAHDTWVMTPQIQQDVQNGLTEGHEIIIDGYDNKACATYQDQDGNNKKQCGLLRIRNSWSALAGDQGDYYMSYDHFKGMVVEAYAIGQSAKANFKSIN